MKNTILSLFISICCCQSARASCVEGSFHKNDKGSIFICDTSSPSLGEAYRTSKGTEWGEPIKRNGALLPMTADQSEEYCASIGAKLPTTDDYSELLNELRHSFYTTDNQTPMIPDLTISEWFWTSSPANGPSYGPNQNFIIAINGPHGAMESVGLFLTRDSGAYARCIRILKRQNL